MKARKDKGKCEACGLPIWKGDEYIDVADEDDWMETKRGKRVIPCRSFFRLHSVCADMVSDDRDEMPAEPSDELEEIIISVWLPNHQGSLGDRKWISIVNVDPPMLNGDTNFQKKVAEWRSFYIERYCVATFKTSIEFWLRFREVPFMKRIKQRKGEHEWLKCSLTEKED